ncbi:SIMPL domain-containing protein [Kitasatospora sp. NBC_01287]|uniref:SIMPL domain-containing protein n=1 Tax=Kitasatospora sp. NBC_01287 TaxID=2903573 RepID=UPI00225AF9DE|nr:SIMPL domain-containing protein [Kitasatospora sp. NBC_01287]MCX4750310.1 SIMPL domain-containing protein [Kitasatospora sp. NBC_01287]
MESAALPTVTVYGEAELEVEPDHADLHLTVQVQDRERESVVRLLAEELRSARSLLAPYGAAVERVANGALWINPERPGSRRGTERITGYRGSAQLHVTVVEFEQLGDIVLALAGLERGTLAGPDWRLRRDAPAHQRARAQAVEAAVLRARQYAGALGSELTGLLSLADQGLGEGETYPSPGAGGRAQGSVSYGSLKERPDLDLRPVPRTVRATVVARFTLRPPDLS